MYKTTKKLTLSAMFIAVGMVLPLLTGQIQQIGSSFLPMHLPVRGEIKMYKTTKKLTLSAMFIAVGMVLPLLTGQIQQIGSSFLPMHLPVILCG